jgi:hypothetical protein
MMMMGQQCPALHASSTFTREKTKHRFWNVLRFQGRLGGHGAIFVHLFSSLYGLSVSILGPSGECLSSLLCFVVFFGSKLSLCPSPQPPRLISSKFLQQQQEHDVVDRALAAAVINSNP